jgi:dihydrofolate reductase
VLTYRPPQATDPAVTFVTDGIASAVATAQAAHEKDVSFFGANTAQQVLAAGLLDPIPSFI